MEYDAAFDQRPAGRPGARPKPDAIPAVRRKPVAALDPLLRAALDSARTGLIVLDNEKRVRLLTRAAAELLGLVPGAPDTAMPVMRLLAQSPWLDDAVLQTLAAAFGGEGPDPREVLLSLPRPGGTRVVAMELRRARGEGWVASLEDVTQSRQTQDWLVEHASTDPITGLWNRQHFMLMLRDRLDAADPCTAVILLDLKRLQGVNDTLGTAVGDAVLRLVGARLLGFLRREDLLCRFVSDEFAVMLGDTASREDIALLGQRLTALIEQPFVVDGQIITIGAHVGAACAPDDGDTPEVLVANAALALAAARAEARGEMRFFEPKLNDEARQRRALEADLRLACARGEFELHYQPQVDLRLARVTGFEALIRWRSPSRGMVAPNDFIPLLEELGLIGDVGEWVVRTACREAVRWPDDITVAVNASPLQVEAGDFGERVGRALADTGLRGHRLEVEITENLLLRDNANVLAALKALRELGVGLVLDDFGTGFASLSALTRFHFDKIKIDRSFISAPDAADEHAAIVRAIAALGISLSVPTTAEGVETLQQLNRVRDNGCTSVQGYFYSKPVPAGTIPGLLLALNRAHATTEP
jgi:diguanylate cyclase (GGDEF)-like protein